MFLRVIYVHFLFYYNWIMVETIGEAMDAVWDISCQCAWGRRETITDITIAAELHCAAVEDDAVC
ncbi:hypothetical protein ASE37_19035 [Rhizobium sp. Root268]|nr:hypothetical protein ASC86_18535 [Rhizobium sp. Root1212]KRD21618.1 hypothetical protein ASE37_19035 [Rhizobium sp. Root268]